jgi:hypothetical protein
MWKVYLRSANLITRNDRIFFNNLILKKFDILGNSVLSRGIAKQEEILSTSLKQPLRSTNQQNTKQTAPKEKNSNFKKLAGIFASGAVTYFAISFYLERNKSKSKGINYESKNLPGKITPSKSVCIYKFNLYYLT